MNTRFTTRYGSMLLAAGILVPGLRAWADPLPGEILKFSQLPLGGAANSPFPGHDEPSTATLNSTSGAYTGTFAADDFSDTYSTPVVHLDWWGSYLADPNKLSVQQFLISFESDVPAGTNGQTFSTPGTVLSSQIVTLGTAPTAPGTFTQALVANGSTTEPFAEQANTVYWLKIVALTNAGDGIQWGWHNRDYTQQDPYASPVVSPGEVNLGTAASPIWHFQDDAVSGSLTYFPPASGSLGSLQESQFTPLYYNSNQDGMVAGVAYSEDLAFNLYTVPEPASLGLLAGGGLLLRRYRKQQALAIDM
jgi:hypothetical protein